MQYETQRERRSIGHAPSDRRQDGAGGQGRARGEPSDRRVFFHRLSLEAGPRRGDANPSAPRLIQGVRPRSPPSGRRNGNASCCAAPTRPVFQPNLWTLARVAPVIARQFGVSRHPRCVWRLLTGMRWSARQPERRARERDAAAVTPGAPRVGPRETKVPRPRLVSRADRRERLSF